MRSGKSWPSSRRERANVRARRRLEEAPSAPCPHCGRVTKTVDGMCADCWGVKDHASAKRWLAARRRQPFFEDPLDWLWVVGAVVAAVLLVVVAAGQWI